MYVCENDHDQIVHDRYQVDCPLCEANSKIEELENEVDDLKDQVTKFEDEE